MQRQGVPPILQGRRRRAEDGKNEEEKGGWWKSGFVCVSFFLSVRGGEGRGVVGRQSQMKRESGVSQAAQEAALLAFAFNSYFLHNIYVATTSVNNSYEHFFSTCCNAFL